MVTPRMANLKGANTNDRNFNIKTCACTHAQCNGFSRVDTYISNKHFCYIVPPFCVYTALVNEVVSIRIKQHHKLLCIRDVENMVYGSFPLSQSERESDDAKKT